jgi:heterodisulfide reductase subunit C
VAVKHPEECIQCGTCITVCPVEMVGGHAIVTWLADPQATDYSVWLCTSCWRCHEACPAGVDIYGLMMERRRGERAPAGYREAFERVLASGLALEISQENLDQARAVWDLEPVSLPPSTVARKLLEGDE